MRSGYLLVGLLKTDRLRDVLSGSPREFDKIKVETLTDDFARIVKGSPEDGLTASDGFAAGAPGEASQRHPAGGHGQAGGAARASPPT